MPYKFDTDKKKIPRQLKRGVKLTHAQRDEIKEKVAAGVSIHSLAAEYKVSRRLIQFIAYPERHAKNIEDRQKRGGTRQYYDVDKHREAVQATRLYRKQLNHKGELH